MSGPEPSPASAPESLPESSPDSPATPSKGEPATHRVARVAAGARDSVGKVGVGVFTGTKAFWAGASAILRGVKLLIVTPWLWKYALAPAVLTFVSFAWLVWWFVTSGYDLAVGWSQSWAGETGALVAGFMTAGIVVAAGLLVFYVAFPALVRIVAAPFLALLAERVYVRVTGHAAPTMAANRLVRWVWLPIRDAVVIVSIRLVITLFALPLNLIPAAGQIAFFTVLLPLEGMDLLDVGMSARAVPLGERLRFVRKNLAAASGLGLGSAGVLFVPIMNVFFLPALIVGAVLLDERISPDFRPSVPAEEEPPKALPAGDAEEPDASEDASA